MKTANTSESQTSINRIRVRYYSSLYTCSASVDSSVSTSFVDFLNSFSVWPKAFPISGNFLGPKMMSAMTIIKIMLGMPILPNPIGFTPLLSKYAKHVAVCVWRLRADRLHQDIFQRLQRLGMITHKSLGLDDGHRVVGRLTHRQQTNCLHPTFAGKC